MSIWRNGNLVLACDLTQKTILQSMFLNAVPTSGGILSVGILSGGILSMGDYVLDSYL